MAPHFKRPSSGRPGVLAPKPEPVRRTTEIEELTNLYLIHPAAARLVPIFARMGITPNAVSITGMLFGIAAGFAYYRYPDAGFVVAGFVLMLAWHVMDGADGQLARLTRSQSRFGQVLDGISDNVTFLAVYTALAIALGREWGGGAYLLVAAAAACHAVQSATYEVQRQEYDCWARGRTPAEPARARSAPSDGARPHRVPRLFDLLHLLFFGHLSFPAAAVVSEFRTRMAAALRRQPERDALIRERYREAFAPLLRRWSILSANYRTLGIFVAALLQAPAAYFAFEIVGFSAILCFLIRAQRVRGQHFFDALEMPDARSR